MRAYKKRLWLETIDDTTQRVKIAQAQRKLCFSGYDTLERCFGELRGERNKGFSGENNIQISPQSSLKNK